VVVRRQRHRHLYVGIVIQVSGGFTYVGILYTQTDTRRTPDGHQTDTRRTPDDSLIISAIEE
jgi:hypothetical protein